MRNAVPDGQLPEGKETDAVFCWLAEPRDWEEMRVTALSGRKPAYIVSLYLHTFQRCRCECTWFTSWTWNVSGSVLTASQVMLWLDEPLDQTDPS